jgi:membrane-associated phospholipid phosphatase
MPPRLLGSLGFVDTFSSASLTFSSGIVKAFANPYAAMPSLHAGDALVLGIALASVVRSRPVKLAFAFWPVWVWFSLLATGNHFWLDVAAGVLLAGLGMTLERFAGFTSCAIGPAPARARSRLRPQRHRDTYR